MSVGLAPDSDNLANHTSWLFDCVVEVDKIYLGTKEKKNHKDINLNSGQGAVIYVVIDVYKECNSGQIKSLNVANTKTGTFFLVLNQH